MKRYFKNSLKVLTSISKSTENYILNITSFLCIKSLPFNYIIIGDDMKNQYIFCVKISKYIKKRKKNNNKNKNLYIQFEIVQSIILDIFFYYYFCF